MMGLVANSAQRENLRIRLEQPIKERLEAFLKAKKITQQEAMEALIAWMLDQDSLLQSLILGQIEPKDQFEIADIVATRLRNAMKRHRPN